ncbi:response regulator [Bradyrhizobium sp. NBAIM08]|uniref:response regulator transcription factor n=1 Tax=Bradyrhizobium sp. NBAIM08 TaxID=2793815 RepID=UPI001CD40069|nr:response regulator [Bradyrhizobium sp. NBAIM08]
MGQPAKIAVIDDDQGFREALEGLIASLGYSAVTFGSAQSFLDWSERRSVVCIVLDVRMPTIDGLELQAKLNAEPPTPPIIFVTSYVDERLRRKALHAGADGFFGKPVDHTALIDCIRSALLKANGSET